MDYRDHDPTLGAGVPAPNPPPDPDDPDDPDDPNDESPWAHCPPAVEPGDLVDLRLRALALAREVGELREQLDRERDEHHRATADLVAYRAAPPPF